MIGPALVSLLLAAAPPAAEERFLTACRATGKLDEEARLCLAKVVRDAPPGLDPDELVATRAPHCFEPAIIKSCQETVAQISTVLPEEVEPTCRCFLEKAGSGLFAQYLRAFRADSGPSLSGADLKDCNEKAKRGAARPGGSDPLAAFAWETASGGGEVVLRQRADARTGCSLDCRVAGGASVLWRAGDCIAQAGQSRFVSADCERALIVFPVADVERDWKTAVAVQLYRREKGPRS